MSGNDAELEQLRAVSCSALLERLPRGQSVGCPADNAKGERVENTSHATILFSPSLRGRRRSAVAAARSHRKSPEKPMCSHVSGDV